MQRALFWLCFFLFTSHGLKLNSRCCFSRHIFEQEKLTESLDALTAEEKAILERQKELKGLLYGRFGKAINLEE